MQTQSTCYKATSIGKPVGILWHDTNGGNPKISRYVQPSDNDPKKAELLKLLGTNPNHNDWNHVYHEAGLNAWIGKLADGTISTVQTMPWNYRPWGCGGGSKGSCNGSASVQNSPFWIQFEICDDGYKDASYFSKVYQEACELTAYLCKLYNIDPNGTVVYNGVTVPTILCHKDSAKLKLGSDHSDIYGWFGKMGKAKNMDGVRKDVAALLKASQPAPVPPPAPAAGSDDIKPGDLMKITGTKYYSGASVPAWVLSKKWYVASVKGGRVVLDKSEDGKSSIMSPFKASDLAFADQNRVSQVIETGDLVKIIGTKYYSGAAVPTWVRGKNWYVYSAPAKSNRIVLDKSEDKKSSIMSPFKRSDLAIVKKG